ncbi:MAG: BatD family protein, partial [Chitinophagales bacterium]|nr:BatD family protein [Chitinophagales bacterium]
STSMQIINGSVSQSMSYSYVLRAKKQGTFKIGKGSIDAGGSSYESNEVTINVTAPSSQQQSQQSTRDPFGNQQQAPEVSTDELTKQIKDDVFVKVILSRNSVYKGEMLTATYKLYFRQNLNGYNLIKAPSLDGFWSKQIDLDPNRKQKVETLNGKQYYTLDLLQYNLYPQRAGNLQISPAEITTVAQVAVQSNDPFDNFFNSGRAQNVPLTLKTNTVTINVKDFPEEGKPKDFSGAVGKFNFETTLSTTEAKTDDAVTYTIKISGEGNLNLLDAPVVSLPQGFEIYDPKVKDKTTSTANGIGGSKQYDYLIIPRMPGEFKISSQQFSFFDPSKEKYFSITSPEYPLKITGDPSKNVNTNSLSPINQQDVSLLGEDIRYIKTTVPSFNKNSSSFFGSAGFYSLYCLPLLAFAGLIVLRRRNETLAADLVGSKRRRALKLSKKRLRIAEKHLAANEKNSFYDEVSKAIWGYLCDKLNIDMAELSKENVEEKLAVRKVKSETISKLKHLINSCEISLYAPADDVSEMKNDYSSALNLIADIEDEIRN